MHAGVYGSLCATALLLTGCFSPEEPPAVGGETDTGGPSTTAPPATSTSPSTMTETTDGSATGTTSTGADDTTGTSEDGASSTGESIPDWGEGDPPDFGDLGDDGVGALLAVHALATEDPIDVWLVGDPAPVATAIAAGDAERIDGIPRDVRRVVFTTSGTTEAVGCSDWFPLRAQEQWAIVAAREEHTCPSPVSDGATLAFEQSMELSGNAVRFVHAAAADPLTVLRGNAPEPGVLESLATLSATDLPDCEASGCSVDYALETAALEVQRHFSFFTAEVSQIPPAGEVLFVVLGDLRQDWPNEPDAMRLVMVDSQGQSRLIARDPEVAFISGPAFASVEWVGTGGPVAFPIATTQPCDADACPVPSLRVRPGLLQLNVQPEGGTSRFTSLELDAGRRYILAFDGESQLVTDTFSRSDTETAVGVALNMHVTETLTLGRRFNGMAQAFPAFTDVAANTTSAAGDVPADDWSLLSSRGGAPLGADCFRDVSTPAGWRGLLGEETLVHLEAWPPVEQRLGLLCF